MKKVIKGEFQRNVNHATGEIIEESSFSMVKFPQEPEYVKMYIKDLCAITSVNDSDQALLRHLLLRLDYEGFVLLSTRIRNSMARSLSITNKTLRNRLNNLVKADLIKPIARNEYRVNPNYFARGNWKSVCEQRLAYSMTISYSEEEGRSITTEAAGDAHLQQPLNLE